MHTHPPCPGVELGFNYPWPIISMEAARDGVELAAAVVERCAAPGGGASGGSNRSTGGVSSSSAGGAITGEGGVGGWRGQVQWLWGCSAGAGGDKRFLWPRGVARPHAPGVVSCASGVCVCVSRLSEPQP
jgi:hypothetical protein